MTVRERAIITAAVRYLRTRANIMERCGNVPRAAQHNVWADSITALANAAPKGCKGCAYDGEQNGRCFACKRMKNRPDGFTRKYV